ncbi:hypothetical protein [Rhodococcus sp. UNC363MFTsu5.1]|uniref:hypothetical protein n=1 Tax=Rhodococcus sp. UNC363MFTsu5.1 TaxID=1449069 RepID=UPI000486B0FC|nr:hypothetical protein [Rhodococcus sp. UNC363MFTsu5.1]
MRFLKLAATAAALVAVPAALAAPAAQALTPRTVFGTVSCKQGPRNSPPVAVWVVADKGESGWAELDNPVGGHGWMREYSYTSYEAERFRLLVGCGGTAEQAERAVVTGWMKSGRHNLTMNF